MIGPCIGIPGDAAIATVANFMARLPSPQYVWDKNSNVITSGSNVTNWHDIVQAEDMFQPTAAKQPTVDGNGYIVFDGINDNLQLAETVTTGAPSTQYAVVEQLATTGAGRCLYSNQRLAIYIENSSAHWYLYANAVVDSGVALTTGVRHVIAVVVRAANDVDLWTDGVKVHKTTGVGFPSRTGTTLGSDASGGVQFANMKLGLFGIYTAAHDDATVARASAYLQGVFP